MYLGCESDNPSWVGDGYCDDETNNDGCLFDGGDCCGPDVNTQYCTLCICNEDLNCDAPMELIGNGICNDEANSQGCNYDGGDCCAACVNTQNCTECICHEGGEPTTLDLSCKSSISIISKKNHNM